MPPTDDVRLGEQLKPFRSDGARARCDLTRVCSCWATGVPTVPRRSCRCQLGRTTSFPIIAAILRFQQLQIIDTWEIEQFGYLLQKLKTTQDRDGSPLLIGLRW